MSDRDDSSPDEPLADVVPLGAAGGGSFELPGLDEAAEDLESPDDADDTPMAIDEARDEPGTFTTTSTTQYDDLAEAVRAADEAGPQDQNVSVHVAGLGAGIATFDDLESGSGVTTTTEEPDEETDRLLGELEAEKVDRIHLRNRILTGVGLVALLGLAAWAGPVYFVALIGLMAVLGAGEYYAAARKAGYSPVAAVGLLAIIGAFVAGYQGGAYGIGWVMVVAVLALLLLYAVTPRREPLENAAVTALGFGWVSLLAFVAPVAGTEGWHQIVALIVFTVAAIDVGAYFAGQMLGRTQLAPTLSPSKTVEGLAGGILLGYGVALAASQVPWMSDVVTVPLALAVATVAALLAPLGDLAESAIKRSVGIKDMGAILPGHGGILDRIDSFLIALPGVYAVLLWLDFL